MKKVRVGVIGAGWWATYAHIPAVKTHSRAELVAENALVAALNRGRPGMAAVDVFENEPVLGAAHPLTVTARQIAAQAAAIDLSMLDIPRRRAIIGAP